MSEEILNLLLVGFEARSARRLRFYLDRGRLGVHQAEDFGEARTHLREESADFVLIAIPDGRRLNLTRLRALTAAAPHARWLALLGEPGESIEHLIAEAGDFNFLPSSTPERHVARAVMWMAEARRLEEDIHHFRQLLETRTFFEGLLGGAAPMRAMYKLIEQVSRADAPVLITGSPGCEFVEAARSIHQRGSRSIQPSVVVECAEGDPAQVESTLFGPPGEGTYPDGPSAEDSAFARAGRGTLVLRDIEALNGRAQERLIAFMKAPFFQGETSATAQPIARLIVTSTRDLRRLAEDEKFNRELYYRLSVLQVRIPPLRERKEDIPMLAEHMLQSLQSAGRPSRAAVSFSSDALLQLFQYEWPGNIRELRAAVREAAGRANSLKIEPEDLPETLKAGAAEGTGASPRVPANIPLRQAKHGFESEYFRNLLKQTGGNMTMASRISKVGRPYLYKKLKEYGIDPNDFR